ncbi:MAG: PH domain-containing protein [Acidobacteriota bacterium]
MDEQETLDPLEPETQPEAQPHWEDQPQPSDPEETAFEPPPPPPVNSGDQPVDPQSVRLARWIAVPITTVVSFIPPVWITLVWALGVIPIRVYLPLILVFGLLAVAAISIAYLYPAARYRHLRYRVEPDGLGIQRGVLWRKAIWIPLTRVQHTDVSQGPLQRRYDLATLTVYTAGTEGASIPLAGLEHSVATRLANHLRPKEASRGG